MLEILNGFLLLYFVVLCTLSALVSILVKPIAACFARPSNEERFALKEIMKLKSEQQGLSMKDEFAAYSKIQRKIYKLETVLKESSQTRLSKSLTIKGSVNIILQVVIALIIVVSVIWFRREPIVALEGDLFPFTTILQYPSNTPNAVSTHVWVLISKVAVRVLLKPITS